MFAFINILDQLPEKLTIVDVGAASMADDNIPDHYHRIINYPHVRLVGFEPNKAACEKLNNNSNPNFSYFPYFVGDGRDRTFYECANPLTSSLYPPDEVILGKFQSMDLPVVATHPVTTVCLDNIPEIGDIDYLKLDVQGSELDVIHGALKKITSAVVIDTEVEFIPIYKDQPVFGDIDVALRKSGFQFVNFIQPFSRQMRPFLLDNNFFSLGGQLMFAESAIYMSNMLGWEKLSDEKLINMATIMHDLYGYFDICTAILHTLEQRTGTPFTSRYVHRFSVAA